MSDYKKLVVVRNVRLAIHAPWGVDVTRPETATVTTVDGQVAVALGEGLEPTLLNRARALVFADRLEAENAVLSASDRLITVKLVKAIRDAALTLPE